MPIDQDDLEWTRQQYRDLTRYFAQAAERHRQEMRELDAALARAEHAVAAWGKVPGHVPIRRADSSLEAWKWATWR